ncbi:MAG TPA: thioredoxin fold domain-containing protein [Terrimicrobiaceae bacterium]
MKTLSLFAAAVIFNAGLLLASPAPEGWQTNYSEALAQAAKENKLVLLDFTGSDWCVWCMKLSKDIFSQPEFKEFAAKNLVLVELDFPSSKPLPDEVKAQNTALATKFGVEGFPTLILADGEGKEVARHVGYLAGGPASFIKWVERARQQ